MNDMVTNESVDLASARLAFEQAVQARRDEVVIAAGFSAEDADGDDTADYNALKRAAAVVVAGAEITNRDDRAKIGLSSGDLYARVLPDAPGADGSEPE